MTISVRPLSVVRKQFLQRILSSHVVRDDECRRIYDDVRRNCPDDDDEDHDDMERTIGIINASLVPGFGLEIRTIVLNGERYHAVVNRNADEVARRYGSAATLTPHTVALLRNILERMVEVGMERDEEEEEDVEDDGSTPRRRRGRQKKKKNANAGCSGHLGRIECINIRNDLDNVHKQKITLADAEAAVGTFVREGWLQVVNRETNDDNDEDSEEEEEITRSSRKKRKPSRKQTSSTALAIGPRTYMELPDFIERLISSERMPQFILYRS